MCPNPRAYPGVPYIGTAFTILFMIFGAEITLLSLLYTLIDKDVAHIRSTAVMYRGTLLTTSAVEILRACV